MTTFHTEQTRTRGGAWKDKRWLVLAGVLIAIAVAVALILLYSGGSGGGGGGGGGY